MNLHLRPHLIAAASALLLGILPSVVSAQSQGDSGSVAEAARRAREQKKSAKPVRTLTNDDLPPAPAAEAKPPAAPSEQANPPDQASENEKAQPTDKNGAALDAAVSERRLQKIAEAEAALKQAKADLALSEHELDILQRKEALDSDSYYSQTNYKEDAAGKAKLDDDGTQINDKKSQVDALKEKITQLEAKLAQLGELEKSVPEKSSDQPN